MSLLEGKKGQKNRKRTKSFKAKKEEEKGRVCLLTCKIVLCLRYAKGKFVSKRWE